MSNKNRVELIGRVGNEPEITVTEKGDKVASFSLATNEFYKDASGKKMKLTDWHKIVAWKGGAEIIQKYVKKGSLIGVEGKLKTKSYQDKTGNKRYVTEVRMENVLLFPSGSDQEANEIHQKDKTEPKQQSKKREPKQDDNMVQKSNDDDLPF